MILLVSNFFLLKKLILIEKILFVIQRWISLFRPNLRWEHMFYSSFSVNFVVLSSFCCSICELAFLMWSVHAPFMSKLGHRTCIQKKMVNANESKGKAHACFFVSDRKIIKLISNQACVGRNLRSFQLIMIFQPIQGEKRQLDRESRHFFNLIQA